MPREGKVLVVFGRKMELKDPRDKSPKDMHIKKLRIARGEGTKNQAQRRGGWWRGGDRKSVLSSWLTR